MKLKTLNEMLELRKLNEEQIAMDFKPHNIKNPLVFTFNSKLNNNQLDRIVNAVKKNSVLPIKSHHISNTNLKIKTKSNVTEIEIDNFIKQIKAASNIKINYEYENRSKFLSKEIPNPLYFNIDAGVDAEDIDEIRELCHKNKNITASDIDVTGNLIAIHWTSEPSMENIDKFMDELINKTGYVVRWRM